MIFLSVLLNEIIHSCALCPFRFAVLFGSFGMKYLGHVNCTSGDLYLYIYSDRLFVFAVLC